MINQSAYLLSKFGAGKKEAERLSLQAQTFIDTELDLVKAQVGKSSSIADIGCGTGDISRVLASQFPKAQVIGMDADSRSLEESRRQLGNQKNLKYVSWRLGSERLPLETPFDFIFMRLVLLHLPNALQALRQIFAMLNPSGRLYLVDCDDRDMEFSTKFSWQEKVLGLMQRVQQSRGGSRHLGRELASLFSAAGFKRVQERKIFYSKRKMGSVRFQRMFEPVVCEYLKASDDPEAAELAEQVHQYLEQPSNEMKICLWHCHGIFEN